MTKRLVALAILVAAATVAATVPRPAGEVPLIIPGDGQKLLSSYRDKAVVLTFILVT